MSRVAQILDTLFTLPLDQLSKDDCNALLQMTLYLSTTLKTKLEKERVCPGMNGDNACQAKSCNFDRRQVGDHGLICNACAKKRERKKRKVKE